jgi:chromosome segregation ATPase
MQQLERVEQAIGRGPSDMRTLVSYLEEKKRIESKIEITRQQIEQVESELHAIRQKINGEKKAIKAEAKAVGEAEAAYRDVCNRFETLLESLKTFAAKCENLVNNLHDAREASRILNEDIAPVTALGEDALTYTRGLLRLLEKNSRDQFYCFRCGNPLPQNRGLRIMLRSGRCIHACLSCYVLASFGDL